MYITYHLDIKTPDNTGEIHHSCLNKDIQDFIVAKGEKQTIYQIEYNGFYQFIYTVTGNRIDVSL